MREAFAMQNLLIFFQHKILAFFRYLKRFNETSANDVVSFEQQDPVCFQVLCNFATRLWKKKKTEVEKRSDRKTIFRSGQGRTLPAQLGQLKTGQDGQGLLRSHLCCLSDIVRLWERLD